ncbi:MAG: hypothetical protein NT038_10100 [Euryarchaeota archaeon]|nr:hypothetical protein [Euryarchaeota archaeon]
MKHKIVPIVICLLIFGSIYIPAGYAKNTYTTEENHTSLIVGEAKNHTVWIVVDNEGNTSVNYNLTIYYLSKMYSKHPKEQFIIQNGTVTPQDTFEKYYPIQIRFGAVAIILETDDNILICAGYVLFRYIIFFSSASG